MGKRELLIAGIVAVLILLFTLHYFVFNIYETSFTFSSRILYADYNSAIKIEAVPINSLGFRIPLKNSPTKFEIIEGNNLVEILLNDSSKGFLEIRAKGETGKLTIRAKPKYSLLPSLFEVEILPSLALKI